MKTLGIIGGTSWHSTVEYYRSINSAVNDAHGNETNPPLIIYNLNQAEIHALQREGRWAEIARLYSDLGLRLQAFGADALLFAANTPHKVFAEVANEVRIPILHIGTATGQAIQRSGLTTVGLIGTLFTMEHDFLKKWLLEHYGITALTPAAAASRERLHAIIQRELSLGIFTAESKRYILDEIAELERRGARGIILGCTEFPLIIKSSDLQIPVFDTLRLHAQMAVDFELDR